MADHNETTTTLHTDFSPSHPALAMISAKAERQQVFNENAGVIARFPRPNITALSLASRIPPELLEYIFSDLFDDAVSVHDSSEETPSIYPEFIEQIALRRINARVGSTRFSHDLFHIPSQLWHIPRLVYKLFSLFPDTFIQSIHVSAEPEIISALLERLAEPAPLLKYIALYSNASGIDMLEMPQINSALFNGYAPLLEDVRISNCTIPRESIVLFHNIGRNLKTLHLGLDFGIDDGAIIEQYDEDDMDERYLLLPSLEDLLLLLKGTPSLEVLQVRGAPGIYSNNLAGASLQNLRSLTLVGGYYNCSMLKEHIVDTQPNIFLNLQCHIDPFGGFEENISDIAWCLRHHVSRLSPDLLSSHVDIELNADNFKLSAENVCNIQARFPFECTADRDWAIHESIHLFPLAASTTLRMNISFWVDAAELITMLRNDLNYHETPLVQTITSLTITGWAFHLGMLCTALETVETRRQSRDEQHASSFIVLPELNYLCIESFSFDWPPSLTRCDAVFQRQLLRMLDLRCRAGKPIQRFELKNCNSMSRSWYRRLVALAADFQTTIRMDDYTESHGVD